MPRPRLHRRYFGRCSLPPGQDRGRARRLPERGEGAVLCLAGPDAVVIAKESGRAAC